MTIFTLGIAPSCNKEPSAPAKEAHTPEPAAPPVVAPKLPPPPSLGMPVDRYVAARVLEGCAAKYGESPQDVRVLVLNFLAGRPHRPVPQATLDQLHADLKKKKEAAREAAAETAREAALIKRGRAAVPTSAPAEELGKPVAPDPSTQALPQAKPAPAAKVVAPPEPAGMSPAGRPVRGSADAKWQLIFDKARAVAKKRRALQAKVLAEIKSCMYAPELGLLDDELLGRYVRTSVDITCAEGRFLGADGKLDVLSHAEEAAKILRKNNLSAREFMEMGVIMARFAEVDKRVHDARRLACPDPRELELRRFQKGRWVGSFKGGRLGVLEFQADEGGLSGVVRIRAATDKLEGSSAKKEPAKKVKETVFKARGVVGADRVHIFASEGLQWLRFDGHRSGDAFSGRWQAELEFDKTSGTFVLARPAPLPGSATPSAAL